MSWKLSPSQIETYVSCRRKWAWRYIVGLQTPSNKSAELGTEVHEQLEVYLAGGQIDFSRDSGYIAQAGIHLLPTPPIAKKHIESEFTFTYRGIEFGGRRDLSLPGQVWDHKSTGAMKWAKTREDLETDIQANVYAWSAFEEDPSLEYVDLAWVYYQTKSTRKAKKVELRMFRDNTRVAMDCISDIGQEMLNEYSKTETLDDEARKAYVKTLTPTVETCGSYGGCPYQGRCNLSPKEFSLGKKLSLSKR
jgi:hypothetical protein